jgi:TolB-like protein
VSFFEELKRRNVPRVALAYLAGSWLLIQVAETLLPIFGAEETGARVLVLLLAIGFVPALILSWLYRWTPEGWRLEVDPTAAGTPAARAAAHEGTRRLDRLIIVTLTLAVGYFAVDKFLLDPARDAQIAEAAAEQARAEAAERAYGQRAIAVMPFRSFDAERVSFAEGIAEQLLLKLGSLPELRVAAASSAFSFRDSNASAREIGAALHVSHLLEGSVHAAGDSVRITARLVDVDRDAQVWAETFDRQLGDVFAIQDEIAASVVEALEVTLGGEIPATRRTNPETYRLYLQAQFLLRAGRHVNDEVEPLLNRAIELDPDYVPALLALARVYNRRSQDTPDDVREHFEREVRALVDRALALDPENGLAHGWSGWVLWFYDEDRAAAVREFERALALDRTNVDMLHGAQQIARLLGQYDEAIILGRYETLQDPICARCYWQLGVSYLVAGDLTASEGAFRTVAKFDAGSDDTDPYLMLGVIQLLRSDGVAALTEFSNLPENSPNRLVGTALASHTLGDEAARDAAVDSLSKMEDASRWLAPIYAWMGDRDRAFEAIRVNLDARYFWYGGLSVRQDPVFRNLHDDPRWDDVLRRLGWTPDRLPADDLELDIPPVILAAVEREAEPGGE